LWFYSADPAIHKKEKNRQFQSLATIEYQPHIWYEEAKNVKNQPHLSTKYDKSTSYQQN